MDKVKSELALEHNRLADTIALAEQQIVQAIQSNEKKKQDILEAKQDMRENSSHSISGLWSSDGFEALAELSQYATAVTDKIVDYEEMEKKIKLLEQCVKSPYFARVDFQFDDEEEAEPIYIGRTSLMEDDSLNIYVYDWRSPIASLFYRFVTGKAYYDAPGGKMSGEIFLKRQYEIKNSILEYFFDADVQIVDEFLRKMLSKNVSTKMKTIVESIQKEQDIVIRDMENELMMVQGVAGSGKTSIALHRVAYLMYQGLTNKLAADNILIISPNSLFGQYIENVLPELGEDNVVTTELESILARVLKRKNIQTKNRFLEVLMTTTRYAHMMKSSIEFKTSIEFMKILDRLVEDIPLKWIHFENITFGKKRILTKKQLKDKLLSRNDVSLGARLQQLEHYVTEVISERHDLKMRRMQKQTLLEEVKSILEVDVFSLYQGLFNESSYLYELADNVLLPDCMEEIIQYTQDNLHADTMYFDDASAMAYLHLKIYGSREFLNIKQVVIDEGQDYYPLHYEIFHGLFPYSKFTILGDINQTLEKQEDLSLYQQIQTILDRKRSSLAVMDKSFRCTNEILNFSSLFIPQHMKIQSFNREGEKPQIYVVSDEREYHNNIISEVNICLEKEFQSIGLICKTEKNAIALFKQLKASIKLTLIKDKSDADLSGVLIMPIYMSKGLEFDAVLICDADADNYQSEYDKKLLYIGSTRALHRLNVFCRNPASIFLPITK